MPSVKNIDQVKRNLLRPALTSHYEVTIGLPPGFDKVMTNAFGYSAIAGHQNQLNLLCSEATLPGSSLATTEINNNFTGVTERHAYRRVFDEVIDLTFYVDAENYLPIRVFETWMAYITGEQYGPRNLVDIDPNEVKSNNYFYRMRYPDSSPGYNGYTATGLTVTKFERDYKHRLKYEFIKSFPRNITAMPVTYNGSDLLRCTVSLTYIRYIVQGISGAQGPAPSQDFAINPTGLAVFNAEKNKTRSQIRQEVHPEGFGNAVEEENDLLRNGLSRSQLRKELYPYWGTTPRE